MYVPVATSALCEPSARCFPHMVYNETHMTNLPSRVMEPEAMELSRTTFACPSWRLSGVWGTKSQYMV